MKPFMTSLSHARTLQDCLLGLPLDAQGKRCLGALIKSLCFPHSHPLSESIGQIQRQYRGVEMSPAMAGMVSYLVLIAGDKPTAITYYQQAVQWATPAFQWLKALIYHSLDNSKAVDRAQVIWEQQSLIYPQDPKVLSRFYLDTEFYLFETFKTLLQPAKETHAEQTLRRVQNQRRRLKNTYENISDFDHMLTFSYARPFAFKLALIQVLRQYLTDYSQRLETYIQANTTLKERYQKTVSEQEQIQGAMLRQITLQKRLHQLNEGLEAIGQAILALETYGHPSPGLYFEYQQHRQRVQLLQSKICLGQQAA